MLDPKIIVRLPINRASSNLYMIRNTPNFSPGSVHCTLYNHCIALKDDYHKKRIDMHAYTPVDFDCLEKLAEVFIIPGRQSQFIQGQFLTSFHCVGSLLH